MNPLPDLPLRAEAKRRSPRSLVDITLDPAQKAAAEAPPGSAMLVLGEAGHGKTTVALHRLAHLYRTAPDRFRAAAIVPHEGLRRLLAPLLTRLGADVPVHTYDAWATKNARRAFGDLPRRVSKTTSVAVSRAKRDPALLPLIEELSRRPPGVIDDDIDAPPPRTRALAWRGDLQHLFGDRALMERLRESGAGLGGRAVDELLEHTRVQFSARTEHANAHVDKKRLVTVDAKTLDDDTPDEDAESWDVEDAAVLFELDRLRAARAKGKPRVPTRLDALVLDEAQELSLLELTLLGRAIDPRSTLVVAGDADQQVDARAHFGGWDETMRALGRAEHTRVVLDVGYRCPPEVAALARCLRADAHDRPIFPAFGSARSAEDLTAWLARQIERVAEDDPSATFAVICRTTPRARAISEALSGKAPRRLVLTGDFVFHRGADLTTVDQIKGLEFDYVIVPDASALDYPDEPAGRRALYVAVTRCKHALALACVGAPTPLLAPR